MNKRIIVIAVLIIVIAILFGCTQSSNKEGEYNSSENSLRVFTHCSDGIVCYHHDDGYDGSGSCFRDEDLINKYCE